MIYLVTDGDQAIERSAWVLGRHGVALRRLEPSQFAEASLAALFAATPGLQAVLRVETALRPERAEEEPEPRVRVVQEARVEAWLPEGPRVYTRAVRGWLDAEGAFRAVGTGLSEPEARALGLRKSALDMALSDFAVEHLYLPERADLSHSPRYPRETVAFDDGVGELLRGLQRLVAAREDPGRELEYRRLPHALHDALRALHPEILPP